MDTLINKNDSGSVVVLRDNTALEQIDSAMNTIFAKQDALQESINKLLSIEHSYNDLIVGAILGAIFGFGISLIWQWIQHWRRIRRYNKLYSKYEGVYLAYKKYDGDEKRPFRCFELKRRKNVFQVDGGISTFGHSDFETRITMDDNNENHGRGYYHHEKEPDKVIRFGFVEIQLAEDVILVHETIYNKNHEQNSDAYRWVKQDYSKKAELMKEHRKTQQQEYKKQFAKYL